MMRTSRLVAVAVVTILMCAALMGGCAAPPPTPPELSPPELSPAEPSPAEPPGGAALRVGDLPQTKPGTLELEGTAEGCTLVRFDGSLYPAPFATYFPSNLLAEDATAAEGEAVRFVANFAGVRHDDAYLQVLFYAAGTSEARARLMVEQFAAARGLTEPGPTFDWSIIEFCGPDGTVALGRHGELFYRVTINAPGELAEGFYPRAFAVLNEWRWLDSGAGM